MNFYHWFTTAHNPTHSRCVLPSYTYYNTYIWCAIQHIEYPSLSKQVRRVVAGKACGVKLGDDGVGGNGSPCLRQPSSLQTIPEKNNRSKRKKLGITHFNSHMPRQKKLWEKPAGTQHNIVLRCCAVKVRAASSINCRKAAHSQWVPEMLIHRKGS